MRIEARFGIVVGSLVVVSGACGQGFSVATTAGTGGASSSSSGATGGASSSGTATGGASTSSGSATTSSSSTSASTTASSSGAAMLGTYVSTSTGNDGNPGTQQKPVKTIGVGIAHAKTLGGGVAVHVAAGQYPEDVTVVQGISLLGGYDAATWSYNAAANVTTILVQSPGGVLVDATVKRTTIVDGFHIQGADGKSTGGANSAGVALTIDGGTPTITNNVITGPAEATGAGSFGVLIYGPSNDPAGPLLKANRITGGSGTAASPCDVSMGILLANKTVPPVAPGAAAEIRGNNIRSGLCKVSNALVVTGYADNTGAFNNDILAGTATAGSSFGVVVVGSAVLQGLFVLDSNRINLDQANAGNCTPAPGLGASWCGGIDSQAAKAKIVNNVVFGGKSGRSTAAWLHNPEQAPQSLSLNSNYLDGGGSTSASGNLSAAVVLTLNNGAAAVVGRIRNNILAGGSGSQRFGVYEDSAMNKTCTFEKLENNDFFLAPTDTLYRSWTGLLGVPVPTLTGVNLLTNAALNLQGDPSVDTTFHINGGSICVDKGSSAEAPAFDFENDARPKGSGFDIGPDEH